LWIGHSAHHPGQLGLDSSPDTDPAYLVTEYCPGALSPTPFTGKTLPERLAMFRSSASAWRMRTAGGLPSLTLLQPDNIFLQAMARRCRGFKHITTSSARFSRDRGL